MGKQFWALLTPILLSVYPAFFLYQVNSDLLKIGDLLPLLLVFTLFAVFLFGIVRFWNRGDPNRASNAVLILLAGFFLYGPIFKFLRFLDLFTIEHRTLLPVMSVLSFYAALFILGVGQKQNRLIQEGARTILGGLVLLNLLLVVPVEIEKYKATQAWASAFEEKFSQPHPYTSSREPDIYYLVMDEAAGFNVIREYWKDERVNQYEEYFRKEGFFIASQSRSSSLYTLYEMASRLNFQYSEKDKDDRLGLMQEISQNKVMRKLKARGYTTIVLDQTQGPLAYPSKTPIVADYNLGDEVASAQYEGQRLNEFSKMVFEITMLRPWLEAEATYDPVILEYRDSVLYAFDRIANLDDISSPKFVYAHLLVTHVPFLFQEDGSLNEMEAFDDWNYYLDNYLFTLHKLQGLVEHLLSDADPENLPIVIIESDHGARNIPYKSGILENFPEENKTQILNIFFLPDVDYSSLKEDIDPVETFPILFERYFGESFP